MKERSWPIMAMGTQCADLAHWLAGWLVRRHLNYLSFSLSITNAMNKLELAPTSYLFMFDLTSV